MVKRNREGCTQSIQAYQSVECFVYRQYSRKAHELLLKIKHWSELINPYPERHKIYPNEELTLDFKEVTREDLTHLKSFAIDNSDSSEADDAISLDGERVWIHIADVATQVDIDSELDSYAQKRASNLYLPDQTIHMLPPNLSSFCSLGESEKSSALSVGFRMIDCQISDIKILQSEIKVVKMSYEEADKALKEDQALSKLNAHLQSLIRRLEMIMVQSN